MKRLRILLALVALTSACGSANINPTSPTPVAAIAVPGAPPPTVVTYYVLSGVVFETTAAGRMPIEGAEIYCDTCGSPDGHTFVNTDANGFYRLRLHRMACTRCL